MRLRHSAFVLLLLSLSACRPYEFKGTTYVDPAAAPDFELARADGGRLRLGDLRGQVVLMFFGFTSCPDVCPTTLAEAKQILESLGDRANQVAFLFITVDPERDTPEVLGDYVSAFHPAIVGLTGDAEELAAVWKAYGIFVQREALGDSAESYTVTHTARVFAVDTEGNLRASYTFGTPYEDILQDVEYLIGQGEASS